MIVRLCWIGVTPNDSTSCFDFDGLIIDTNAMLSCI